MPAWNFLPGPCSQAFYHFPSEERPRKFNSVIVTQGNKPFLSSVYPVFKETHPSLGPLRKFFKILFHFVFCQVNVNSKAGFYYSYRRQSAGGPASHPSLFVSQLLPAWPHFSPFPQLLSIFGGWGAFGDGRAALGEI